ncbi:MAG: C13 family peptidase [Pedobacter sp.]|nr:C13 family peptidase [Pedobacter sp.]
MPGRIPVFFCSAFFLATAFAQAAAPDGAHYEGSLTNGLRQGPGKISWSNGVSYEGGFAQGQMSGRGKLVLPGGEIYEGEFQQGLMSGQGKLVSKSSVYEGEFRKGVPWGKGKQTTPNGTSYNGEFVSGQPQGHGRLATTSGDVYEGDFVLGELTHGSITSKAGTFYEGDVKNWLADGKGRFIAPDKTEYSGNFTQGMLNGKGRMRNGKRQYEGELRNYVPDGEGTLTQENGDVYTGHFKNGLYHGKGILTYASPGEDGKKREAGIWAYGELEDKAAEKQRAENIESALYQQGRLLDEALAGITAGQRTQGTLFFLNIAGDGSQEVFHRETRFVSQQFEQEFSTAGHAINLVNSRNTLTSLPLATNTSIRQAVQRIASVMDKDRDILFIYMSSHGSRTHEFLLNPPGMEVANLTATDLGQMLKDSGIRWKVVVISACYSGGFLDPLKDDGTLVITAARKDRASFGCADENDFTYFGRAFFKEALPQSQSFQQAFEKASALVREWELRDMKEAGKVDEKEFSLPQMQNPPAIEKKLKDWWPPQKPAKS